MGKSYIFSFSINQLFILSSRTIHDSIPLESHNSHPEMAKIAFAGLREPWAFQFVGRFSLVPTNSIGGSGNDTADRGFGSWRRGGCRCYFRYLCEWRYNHSLPVAFTRPKASRRSLRPHFRVFEVKLRFPGQGETCLAKWDPAGVILLLLVPRPHRIAKMKRDLGIVL